MEVPAPAAVLNKRQIPLSDTLRPQASGLGPKKKNTNLMTDSYGNTLIWHDKHLHLHINLQY
jgi:hypothetical protein